MAKAIRIINGVRCYSTEKAAEILGVERRTMSGYCCNGELKYQKKGASYYFAVADIKAKKARMDEKRAGKKPPKAKPVDKSLTEAFYTDAELDALTQMPKGTAATAVKSGNLKGLNKGGIYIILKADAQKYIDKLDKKQYTVSAKVEKEVYDKVVAAAKKEAGGNMSEYLRRLILSFLGSLF